MNTWEAATYQPATVAALAVDIAARSRSLLQDTNAAAGADMGVSGQHA